MTAVLTSRQHAAQSLLASSAKHVLLRGGSRSGKTFLMMRALAIRAIKAPKSRHAAFRLRFNAIASSLIADTFPKVMASCFPHVSYEINRRDWFAQFPNGSELWFCGLDDGPRVEKVLGMEFATIFLNEVSQIPLESRDIALTRLAQLAYQEIDGKRELLKPRAWYDCNPPPKSHWSYRLFVEKVDPETRVPLADPDAYASMQINPEDNVENIAPDYMDTLRAMSPRLQKRFLRGEFADANPNALFPESTIEKWRVLDSATLPDFVRVVVAVDPSGSGDVDNADNDEIGIVVLALGLDGIVYVLEDLTVKAGPATWGAVATTAFERHQADAVVAETNFGGAMVEQTISVARPRTPFKAVTASRGKVQRAEPFSALYEQGKVRHVGRFIELEDELAAFSTVGYTGSGSPNRADAAIWGLAELFPAMVRSKASVRPALNLKPLGPRPSSWQGA